MPMQRDFTIGLECLIRHVLCLTCHNNKPKPKHRNEFQLEEWQNETVPFGTIHIDHRGPIHPTSASNVHCLLIVDAFSRLLMVYPVSKRTALATISAVEKWILFLESRSWSSLTEALLLSTQSSSIGPKNLELLYDLVQLIHPGRMVKLKHRTSTLLDTEGTFLTMPEITGLH